MPTNTEENETKETKAPKKSKPKIKSVQGEMLFYHSPSARHPESSLGVVLTIDGEKKDRTLNLQSGFYKVPLSGDLAENDSARERFINEMQKQGIVLQNRDAVNRAFLKSEIILISPGWSRDDLDKMPSAIEIEIQDEGVTTLPMKDGIVRTKNEHMAKALEVERFYRVTQ